MPLVAHNGLPAFERLREEGIRVLPADSRCSRISANCISVC